MDIGTAFEADSEASELVQPGDGALDHPADDAQVPVLVGALLGQPRLDAADAQGHDVAGGRVAPLTRATDFVPPIAGAYGDRCCRLPKPCPATSTS